MENLKIKVGNDKDEIIDLLKQYGCKYFNFTGSNGTYLILEDGKVFFCKLKSNFNASKCKEITLPELRDLVVLKRNDRKDRTHTDQDNWSWFISSSGTGYVFGAGNANGLHQWDESSLNMVDLKPIDKKEMKEYLVKSQDGNWRLETDLVGDPADTVIEVPCGAEAYLINPKVQEFLRNINGGMERYCGGDWRLCLDDNISLIDRNFNNIVWQRNPETKQAKFLVKTDSGYVSQVLDENAGGEGVVRIPDGAEIAILASGVIFFWKSHFFNGGVHKDWVDMKEGWGASRYLKNVPSAITIWKRETLNDQVASAEEYREMISNADIFGRVYVVPDIAQSCDDAFPTLPPQDQSDFPLNNHELNHRVAKAFNAVRGTDLNEDDVNYLRELINLTVSHYGERK